MSDQFHDAVIRGSFDLGYILALDDGREAQLRAPEQRDWMLECHLSGNENQLFGESIKVYLISCVDGLCLVSQFTPEERRVRMSNVANRLSAATVSTTGQEYLVVVERELDWGYIVKELDGFLEGAIKKPIAQLYTGDVLKVRIVEKGRFGATFELLKE